MVPGAGPRCVGDQDGIFQTLSGHYFQSPSMGLGGKPVSRNLSFTLRSVPAVLGIEYSIPMLSSSAVGPSSGGNSVLAFSLSENTKLLPVRSIVAMMPIR